MILKGAVRKIYSDLAESKVLRLQRRVCSENEGPQNVDTILEKTLERIELLYKTPQDGVTGVNTGFTDLNKKRRGYKVQI
ncbi:hypothetical protein ACT691_04900 [Vibrio metschnikovii]